MNTSKLRCVFCEKGSFNPVHQFDAGALRNCKKVLHRRIWWKFKYDDIELPDAPNTIVGYHSACFKRFNNIEKIYFETDPTATDPTGTDDSPGTSTQDKPDDIAPNRSFESEQTEESEQSSNSEFCHVEKTCLFCGKARKKYRRKEVALHISSYDSYMSIKNMAQESADSQILNLLQNYSASRPCNYHTVCYNEYNYKTSSASKEETSWQIDRSGREKAFKELELFLEREIVEGGKAMLLSTVMNTFEDFLQELGGEDLENNETNFSERYLERKITEKFNKKLQTVHMHKKKIITRISGINSDLSNEVFQELQEDDALDKAADILRKRILKIKRNKLPIAVTTKNILEGECSIPPFLLKHYETIICSRDHRRQQSRKNSRQVNYHRQDLIYAVTNGKIRTLKHTTLGLVLKSRSSSKELVTILNRCGHCVSYNEVIRLETDLTYAATERSHSCPKGIARVPHLSTGVAFDNFDRFVETASGKDTLHDTVGVIY